MTAAGPAAASAPRRRGRPARTGAADGPGARDRILAAARAEFAERGYDKTSVRGIAKTAGVDPALVHHYFGTKEQVFAAAIELSMAPALSVPEAVVAGERRGAGERMARGMFQVWESPETRAPMLAVLRSAVTNETAAGVLRSLIERRVLERMAVELGGVPDPKFRAQLASGQLIGIAMLRYVIRMEPIASADIEEIIAMVGPTLQRYLTES
ncbi:TetR family transcriptional regulator [Streptomyces pactum]|uniref:TetR family transcriptional regulator n=1 Tax=Streptomyces pactum TaxID=68249 RepID=A0ABS0NKD5_9ACTN|nr:TetR family transcriptional regulator [Streptomyces pactum]MBH5335661.1 TetR family transcriptional regulator [Streptomyces pactum]